MLAIKQNLLTALAAELETLLPGAGARAAFESPKVAAHGDFASTAAMQLAKPLGKNPRQVAEALRESLLKTAVYSLWVEAIDIAGPGFMNIKLKPAAKQEVVREILSTNHFLLGSGFELDVHEHQAQTRCQARSGSWTKFREPLLAWQRV